MKKLEHIQYRDLVSPGYTFLQTPYGVVQNIHNSRIEEFKKLGWFEAQEDTVIKYFIKYVALPWKVNVCVPFYEQRSQGQGYTKMMDQLAEGISEFGVSFSESINESTDAILIINSVWVQANTGQIYEKKQEAIRLGIKLGMFTMFESTRWMDVHVKEMEYLDFLIVPNQWNKDCLIAQGYTRPIYVCNLPNSDHFDYIERPIKRDTFTFLMYNAMDYRKGYPEYLEAFIEEFKDETDVKFILKTRENDPATANNYIQNPIFGSKIQWIIKTMYPTEVALLHEVTDCFVFPSKGEGWGYPPLEALLTGNPVIATNEHSHKEWFNDACLEVETYMDNATYSIMGEAQEGTGQWYVPKVDSIRKQMRAVYEMWKAEGREAQIFKNAKKQSQLLKAKFDKKAVAKNLLSILKQENILTYDEVEKRKRGRPRKNKSS